MTLAIVMGVSGSGKTTVAAGIAQALGWTLLEGDAFHPPANVAKMRSGTPLTDEDRWPWLRAIAARAHALSAQGQSTVIACSALKRAYRDILTGGRADAVLVYLEGSQAVIAARMAHRQGHFMPPGLLDSQFATLQPPGPEENPVVVDIAVATGTVIADAVRQVSQRLA